MKDCVDFWLHIELVKLQITASYLPLLSGCQSVFEYVQTLWPDGGGRKANLLEITKWQSF